MGIINKKDTKISMFHTIYKQSEGLRALKMDDELARYIKFHYGQVHSNYWNKPEDFYEKKPYAARQCNKDDFISLPDEAPDKVYNAWKQYSVLCPDIPDGDDF